MNKTKQILKDMENLKESLKNLIIDYIKIGYTHKEILKQMEAVIYWELRDNGFKK